MPNTPNYGKNFNREFFGTNFAYFHLRWLWAAQVGGKQGSGKMYFRMGMIGAAMLGCVAAAPAQAAYITGSLSYAVSVGSSNPTTLGVGVQLAGITTTVGAGTGNLAGFNGLNATTGALTAADSHGSNAVSVAASFGSFVGALGSATRSGSTLTGYALGSFVTAGPRVS